MVRLSGYLIVEYLCIAINDDDEIIIPSAAKVVFIYKGIRMGRCMCLCYLIHFANISSPHPLHLY